MNILDKIRETRGSILNTNNIISNLLFEEKRMYLEQRILHDTEPGITDELYTNHNIIVSLTTYGRRLYEVALTIESIMEQTMKANRIILWLEEGLKDTKLPQSLVRLQKRGLEIYFCEDLKSYKKLVPTLKMCPNDCIITIDDDLIYSYDLLENLIIPYLKEPHFIYTHRAHKIILNEKGYPISYKDWEFTCKCYTPSALLFPTGGGGTLYPPYSLHSEVLNSSVFMEICPYADDVWFKAMALYNNFLACSCISHHSNGNDFIFNNLVQDMGLYHINLEGEALNDQQIKAVFKKYNLYKKFIEY